MLFIICANNSQVIVEVLCPWAVLDDLPNNLLELFRGHVYTKKQGLVSVKAIRGSKGCNVP